MKSKSMQEDVEHHVTNTQKHDCRSFTRACEHFDDSRFGGLLYQNLCVQVLEWSAWLTVE
jgi:hypothetical protein